MNGEKQRIELATAIAQRWNKEGLRYAIVHGLEGYPHRIGRDLDIAVCSDDVPYLVRVAVKIAKEKRFPHVLFRWSHWGLYQLVLIDENMSFSLPLDFLCTTDVWRAKLIQIVDFETLERFASGDGWKGPFRVSSEGHFYKVCLRSLLCGDVCKLLKEYTLPISIPELIAENVKSIVGNYGLWLLSRDNETEFAAEFPKAVKRLQVEWCKRHPFKCVVNLLLAFKGKIARRMFNQPLIIFARNSFGREDVLKDLIVLMKPLFVDLRVKDMNNVKFLFLERISNPPISEFVVVLINARDARMIQKFDLEIDCSVHGIQSIKAQIIQALEDRYRVPQIMQ